jgi:hypothetical protein
MAESVGNEEQRRGDEKRGKGRVEEEEEEGGEKCYARDDRMVKGKGQE